MSKQAFGHRWLGLWIGILASIQLTLGVNLIGAGIPWSNGQALEYSITGLSTPDCVAVDATHGKIYVTERGANRVLRFGYPLSSNTPVEAAEMVFGQSDFSGTSANRGGSAAANTINLPYGLAVAANGDLWVADYNNNRVLKYASAWTAASGVAASVVLGQGNFTSTTEGTTSGKLIRPCGVSVDASDNLWVADLGNNRVLRFASASTRASGTAANNVLGQSDFTSGLSNRGGTPAANTVANVYGLCAAGTNLWVADSGNNRVLRFANPASKSNGAVADGVLGQPNFTSNSGNLGTGIAANSLSFPAGVAGDADGRLYIDDSFNHRLLIFVDASLKANGAAADYYLGASSFTSPGSMSSPWHVVYDNVNHRLLVANPGANIVNQYFNCYTTSIEMTSAPNPSTVVGAAVTFTATVTTSGSGPAPSGYYMSFNEGASSLGTASISAAGQAVFSTTALSDGTHNIVAVLTNTPTHKGSQSTPLAQVVGKYTPTFSLASSLNPSTALAPVVFTATVTPPSGAPTPTGAVEFFLDGTSAATVNLNGGVAAWTNSALTEGGYTISAIYGGDTDFRNRTNTLNQTVNPEGLFVLPAVANIERDADSVTNYLYDGNFYGGYVYCGAFDTSTGFAAFKFDLSGLSGTILSASLQVRVGDKYLDASISNPKIFLHTSMDDAWSDVDPLSAPGSVVSPALAEFAFNDLNTDDWITNDVASFVRSQYAGDKLATFVFNSDATSGYNYIGFYSKESYPTNRPYLQIQMAPPDVTSPAVTNVIVPSNGTYVSGQAMEFTVNYDEPVLVAGGTPYLSVTLDTGGTVQASYVSGSGTKDLVFRYTVVSGNLDVDGIVLGSAIASNGATLKDAAGNAAVLALNGVGSTSAIHVDAVAPAITISAPSPAVTTTGPVEFTVTYVDTSMQSISLAPADISLNSPGTANGTIGVSGTGWTRTVTISSITGHGTLGISIAAATASDTAGNLAAAAGPSSTATVNLLPVISGTVSGQAVNDNATLAPFGGVTIANTDVPAQTLACTVSLDNGAKGAFTPASLTASGFTSAGSGAYALNGTASAITTAIRLLVFAPTANHVTRGSTETTTFTISATDGVFTPVTDNITTVVTTSVNHSPTAAADSIQRFGTQGVKVSTTTLLGNDTDPDSDPLSITAVSATSPNGASIYLAGSWIHYVPAAGFTSDDTFTYSISDGNGGTSTGTVTVGIKTDSSPSSNQIGSIVLTGPNNYRITFGGIPGRTYTIEGTDNLLAPYTWQTLGTSTADPTGIITFDDNTALPMRLYRTVYP